MLFFGHFQEKLLCSHWERNCVTGSVTSFICFLFLFRDWGKKYFCTGESHVSHAQEQIFLCDVVVNLLNGNICLC